MADLPELRVGYLWVPHLPLAVAMRRRPELEGEQVIIGDGRAGRGAVLDASEGCLAAGVRIGRPLREAREYCPGAAFLSADLEADRRAHEALLDLIGEVAPAVEDDGLGRALFVPDQPISSEDARWMIATLRAAVRERLGLGVRLALAPGPFAAKVAAERDPEAAMGTPVLVAGEVAAYLARLPVEVLPLPPRAMERLRLLGLATVGEFARLPRGGLARRFGSEAVATHKLAHGEDDRAVVGRTPLDVRTARRAYEPPVEALEPLLAGAAHLLGRLCAELRAEGSAFRRLTVWIQGESGRVIERTAELRAPALVPEDCREVLRSLVCAAAPGDPATALAVRLSAIAPAGGAQLELFAEATARDDRKRRLWEATSEIGRRYPAGLRRVVPSEVPTLLDEYWFGLLPYEPDPGSPPPPPEIPPAALRAVVIERHGGRPCLVEDGRRDELLSVHSCWRAEEWWPAEVERVYWRVRARSGRVLTLSRDAEGFRLVEVLD